MSDILESFKHYNVHLALLMSLNRHNPNVMKRVARLLECPLTSSPPTFKLEKLPRLAFTLTMPDTQWEFVMVQ